MNTDEVRRKILRDEDFVFLKRHDYSLKKAMERYADGAPDHVIASALMVTEDEVQPMYDAVVAKLRRLMGVA